MSEQLDWSLQMGNYTYTILHSAVPERNWNSFWSKNILVLRSNLAIYVRYCTQIFKRGKGKWFLVNMNAKTVPVSSPLKPTSWYLEDDLVVRGWGPAHPQGKLTRISLHMFCHSKLWCLRGWITCQQINIVHNEKNDVITICVIESSSWPKIKVSILKTKPGLKFSF